MTTIRERLEDALVRRGERLVGRKGKYLVMTRSKGGYYFLGENGALRRGSAPSNSYSLTDSTFYDVLLGKQYASSAYVACSPSVEAECGSA